MGDEDEIGVLRDRVLERTGARDLREVAEGPALARIEPDLAAVLRLRLGLDRRPERPRTRAEVAEALGVSGPRIEEGLASIEDDAVEALGPGHAAP